MKHLGDITEIDTNAIDIPDLIIGGSPCQDLSLAGKRAGLAGERSGLFMEQIRIVKELRERDARQNRRTDQFIRPRWMVWENVFGAFSSGTPKGADFQAVLTQIVRIAEPDAPDVPLPEKGWSKSGCLYDELGRWSVAWRLHDAQFWGTTFYGPDGNVVRFGTPQRRRRIALVADFGGLSAAEVLFERKGLSGDLEQGESARQDVAGSVAKGVGGTEPILLESNQNNATVQTEGISTALPASMGMGGGYVPMITDQNVIGFNRERCGAVTADELMPTLQAAAGESGNNRPMVCLSFQERAGKPGGGKGILIQDEHVGALSTLNNQMVFGISGYNSEAMKSPNPKAGIYEADTARTLDLNGGNPACNQGGIAIVYDGAQITNPTNCSNPKSGDPCHTLHADSRNLLVKGVDAYNQTMTGDVSKTLNSIKSDSDHVPCVIATPATTSYGLDRASYNQGKNAKFGFSIDEELIGAQTAKGPGAVFNSMVRRLTPKEAERLQGFPDDWTNIGEWTDQKGKVHQTTDSARYKALGNSICLPFWEWLLRRIAAQYERVATLGSLFDGIGGFPLCWQRVGGVTLWASEIEPFCIAVTEKRFNS